MAVSTKRTSSGSHKPGSSNAASRRSSNSKSPLKLPPIQPSNKDPTQSRHRCPHHPQGVIHKGNQPCLLSEYTNKYHQHPIEPRKPIKPHDEPHRNAGPMDDKTTHRLDYIPHPTEKPWTRTMEGYRTPDGNFDHLTSYKKEYIERPLEKTRPIRKDQARKVPGKFSGEPTYKVDYRQWAIDRREPVMHDSAYRPSSAPFQGNSNYTTDYIKHKSAPRTSMKPAESTQQSQPFDGTTGYRQEYDKKPIPPRYQREVAKYEVTKAPLDDLSNYRKDYTEKQASKMASCKPDAGAYRSDAPIEKDTTHRVDYKKWPAGRPHVHEPEQYQKPEGDMYMDTTSHTDYTKKPLERTMARRPMERKGAPGKFDGSTNYREDFRKWGVGDRPRPHIKSEYVPPDTPFKGNSNYTTDYIKHNSMPRQSLRPNDTARQSDQPFDDKTGYREEYIRHTLPERYKRDMPKYLPNGVPLDGLSNYMKDFIPKQGQKMASCKPDNDAYQSNAPFDEDTTHRVDYKKWPAERPFVHEPDQYIKPEGNMDMNTTSHIDYTKKPLEPNPARRPMESKRASGKFDGTTNYKEDYRKWAQGQRSPVHMKNDYLPPDAPFEGMPTYTSDYTKHMAPPRQSLKPVEAGISSNAPFEGHTMYRSEFIKKNVPPCPAAILGSGTSQFVFSDQDTTGHKWYQPATATSVMELPARVKSGGLNRQLTALSVA